MRQHELKCRGLFPSLSDNGSQCSPGSISLFSHIPVLLQVNTGAGAIAQSFNANFATHVAVSRHRVVQTGM